MSVNDYRKSLTLPRYSSYEKLVKRNLDKMNLREGIDYFHNYPVTLTSNNRITHYWFDFIIPKLNMVIEVSPDHWHNKRDETKKENYIRSQGLKLVELNDVDIRQLKKSELPNMLMERIRFDR